jgi:hypothetical protein
MGLRWEMGDGWSGAWRGWTDGGLLAATVVPYDDSEWVTGADGLRRPVGGARWWAAFVAQERVEGRFASAEAAMAAADRRHERR